MSGPNTEEGQQIYQNALATNEAIDISGYSDPRTFAEAEVFVDAALGLNQFKRFSTMTGNSTSRPATTMRAYLTQIDNVISTLERSGKLPGFLLTQTALHILNPAVSVPPGFQRQFVNPLTIITGPPPLLGGLTTDSINPPISGLNPVTDLNEDTLLQLYKGYKVDVIPEAGIPPVRIEGPKTRLPKDDGGALGTTAAGLVNQIGGFDPTAIGGDTLDQKAKELNLMDKGAANQNPGQTFENTTIFEAGGTSNVGFTDDPNASERARFMGDGIQRPNLAGLFESRKIGPAFGEGRRGFGYSAVKRGFLSPLTNNAKRQRAAQRSIDSFMNSATREFEQNNGFLNTKLADQDTVVPFYFQDLRDPTRYLYFKAFITSLTENLAPEWNKERFYGRVDPVGTYMSTLRTFSISFMIVAMSQEGLITMWKKINNLCKMVYPTFDRGVLSQGPAVRLRIGDLCADEGGQGLPGWIENLSFDYTNVTWEILPDIGIAPMWSTVSFQFQVIHETTPKLDSNYNFSTKHFRRIGALQTDSSQTSDARSQQTQSTLEEGPESNQNPPSSDEGIY